MFLGVNVVKGSWWPGVYKYRTVVRGGLCGVWVCKADVAYQIT